MHAKGRQIARPLATMGIIIVVLALAACALGVKEPATMLESPSATEAAPASLEPTETPGSATATRVPSTETPESIPDTQVPPTGTATEVPPTRTPSATSGPPTATPPPAATPALAPLPPEPQKMEFRADDGQMLQWTYYRAARNPAPMVVLMHWAPGAQNDWSEIAFWLQNRGLGGKTPNPEKRPWLDPSWFPPMLKGESFGVFAFTFRGCEGGCRKLNG